MGWTVQGSNPDGGKIFCTHTDYSQGPPSLLYSGYWDIPRGKVAGHGVNHPSQSSAEAKERVELYLYSPSVPSWRG